MPPMPDWSGGGTEGHEHARPGGGDRADPGARRAHRPVGWHTRLLRLLTGQARVPRDARLVILAAMAQTIATSGFSTYVGIWAIEGLHASAAALGVALLLRAGSGVLTGPVGGRWSDTHGRRPVIVGSWLAQAACIGAFAVVGHSVAIGLTLVVLFGPLGPPGRAAAAAYIADVTSPGERPVAYSALRSAQALAQITGPAIAAVLAGGSRWPIMFGTLAVISFAAACGAALLPRRRDSLRPGRTAAAAARTGSPWRDFPYVAFLIAVVPLLQSSSWNMSGCCLELRLSCLEEFSTQADWERKHLQRTNDSTMSKQGVNLGPCLPGVYWLTIFGETLRQHFGTRLEDLTVEQRIDLHHDAIGVILAPRPDSQPEVLRKREEAVMDALGRDYFFDIKEPSKTCKSLPY